MRQPPYWIKDVLENLDHLPEIVSFTDIAKNLHVKRATVVNYFVTHADNPYLIKCENPNPPENRTNIITTFYSKENVKLFFISELEKFNERYPKYAVNIPII